MYTKSLIQQNIENIRLKESFNDGLNNLMDKYNIEDSIFIYNGSVKEVTNGYFVESKEFDNLKDAINNYDINMGIRIMENERFQIGYIYNQLSQCPKDSHILDIQVYENVR